MVRAFLKRQRLYTDDACYVQIGDDMVSDDGLRIDMGPVDSAWWDVPLPTCPDCGGEIVWYEAGYVPGTRVCTACGSLFSVQTEQEEMTKQTGI